MSQYTRGDTEGLWDWNLVSNRIHFSPRWVSHVGCEDHEVGNTPEEWIQRVHPDDVGQVLREIEAARAGGVCELDFRHRLRHKDGAYRWMSCRGVVVRNEGGQVVRLTGSHSDITVETVTDPMTGLPNRLLFLDRLTRSIERANRYTGFHFAVLLIELGRDAGAAEPPRSVSEDPLLTAAARRLETCLRVGHATPSLRHNDLVARMQGDQFAVLLDGLKDVSHAKVVADRILMEILATFTVSGREVHLPASLGIAVSATGYSHAEDVLRDAETALHRAQVLGGSHCELFDTAILKSERAELQLEDDLKKALDQLQFELFYQPVVSLASNQVVGFEALVRWQHPVLGTVPPLDFIPLTERTGFIVPLGNWILREACRQLKAWQESLPPAADMWVSVNLSSVQVKHPALIEQIGDALRDSGLQARSLVLELTEGIAMENPTAVKTLLMQLRAMGIRISIDDFGTGHSSLAYLRQFPVDALKIDRSFVRGMETQKDMADIIGTLTTMAQQLGLHVVAEGVENEEQLAVLRALRCESVQGYLFAKPLDVNKATDLLRTGLQPRGNGVGDQEPEAQRPDALLPVPQPGRSLSPSGRWLSIAAAALALATCAGLVAQFSNGFQPDVPSSSSLPPAIEEPGPRLGTVKDGRIPIRAADTAAGRAAAVAAASGTKPKQDRSAQSSPQPAGAGTSEVAATRLLGRAPGSPPEAPAVVVRPPASLKVVHLHRVGSCQGRLVVSRGGVAFVPDEKTEDDAFALKYTDFLPTLSDNTLTIKSNRRTYRFKAAAVAGKEDDGSRFHEVMEGIAHFR